MAKMKVKARFPMKRDGKDLKKGDVFEIEEAQYGPMMCGGYIDGYKEPKQNPAAAAELPAQKEKGKK